VDKEQRRFLTVEDPDDFVAFPTASSRTLGVPPKSAAPLVQSHTKFTPRLQVVNKNSLQMTNYGGAMTRDRKGDTDDFPC
jgi:hypothetical protein